MASTTAFFTGLTGLNAHARNLDVIGNNIANVNTTAYKSSRMLFSTAFARTFSLGSAPSTTTGGTNPTQVGQGVNIAGTQRNFNTGAINATGDLRDLAIEGDGMFVVDRAGTQLYTRAGAFRLNAGNDLVNIDGDRVMGFGVDERFNVVDGSLAPLNIPMDTLTVAEATRTVRFAGNLNASGAVATQGSRTRVGATETAGFSLVSSAAQPTPPNVLETSNLLTEIEDPDLPGSDAPLFAEGQTLELSGAEKGGKLVSAARMAITAASTVADLLAFLGTALGIDTDAGPNPDGSAPGVALDTTTGELSVVGNTGTVNDIALESSDLRVLDSDGVFVRSPFVASRQAAADGESVRTTFVAYDSLGTQIEADLAMVLEGKSSSGTTWRYYAESGDDTDLGPLLGTGLVSFDTSGRLASGASASIDIDREATGAQTPLSLSLALADDSGAITALADLESSLAATFQDGSPIGTLTGYAVGDDGLITGTFTNGLTRTLGRLAVATFTNTEGLVDEGGNMFSVGPNSGSAVVTTPGQFGTGRIVSGALEMSNVDLSAEFINMILTSTGFTASSRVIQTTDELMQQLLVIGR